jgi:hypothetical protein
MAVDRRPGGFGGVAGAGAAGLPAVAELPHPADRDRAGALHLGQFPHRLFQHRDRPPVPQFGSIRDRGGRALALPWHRARLDERAHQYAVQEAVFRPLDHPAGNSEHPVRGVLDHAGEPEDRHHQRDPAGAARDRHRLRQHLHHDGHDLGRRAALLADGLPAHDGGLPGDGSLARGIRADERGFRAAGRAPDHLAAGLAGRGGLAPDPAGAGHRIVRGPGAARPAGRHPCLYVVDLSGDPPISEPGRPRLRLCGDASADDLGRHLSAVAAVRAGREIRHRHRQGLPAAHHRPRRLALCDGGCRSWFWSGRRCSVSTARRRGRRSTASRSRPTAPSWITRASPTSFATACSWPSPPRP